MKSRLFSLLLSALCLTGCFHLPTQSRPVNKYVEDPAVTACRERGMNLLKQYAPDSYWLMQNYYAVQQKQVERGLIIMSADIHDPFFDFFSAYTKEIDIMKNLAALVHESNHGLIRYLGTELALTQGKNTRYPKKYYGILLNETERFLVDVTPFFPTREIDASAPAELRATSRYQLYVLSPSPDQGTQQDGIYGLLDEWAAYYWTLRTDVSLLSYYGGQKETAMPDIVYAVSRVDDWYHAYLEFKCFMLQYLLYARAHTPEAYHGIMGNREFRRAFTALDQAFDALQRRSLETTADFILSLIRQGYQVERQEPLVFLVSNPEKKMWLIKLREEFWKHKPLENLLGQKDYAALVAELAQE